MTLPSAALAHDAPPFRQPGEQAALPAPSRGNEEYSDAANWKQREKTSSAAVPLLVSARDAAVMCGKSLRTWRAWDAAGWIPRPVRIGRSTLWRVDELREWVAAGCPRRAEWEASQ
jgi:predicted DNA-binding transcriptional regulator AlpA